jgi:predicted metal-dependent hydrolase
MPEIRLVETPTTIHVFGRLYQKMIELQGRRTGVWVQPTTGHMIVTPASGNARDAQRVIDRFVMSAGKQYLTTRVPELAERMQIPYQGMSFREQSSRWGSCSSRRHLSFNWRLAHFTPDVVDYVIMHELAHIRQMNHSAKFWAIVEQYDPHFRSHRRALRYATWQYWRTTLPDTSETDM